MSDPQIKAAFYLSPTLDGLWRWSEDGEVLTWPDGTTIAFRGEVEQVIKRLAPGGLPPFGAVALLLAACRDSWPTSRGRDTISGYAFAFRKMIGTSASVVETGGGAPLVFARVGHHIRSLISGLDAVHALPGTLRETLAAKLVLAETVLEGQANRSSVEDAQSIVQAIEEGINPETLRPQLSQEESLSQFSRQVDGLTPGLARVDAAFFERRARTGLDEEVIPAEEDLSPSHRVRQLLAALREDPELAALARLAQDLMAAVTIPRSLHAREELPAGGVSDLSNRGPLDRLLVSELAHDDLTLAVRVAVNEALYLRPESPPREPPHRRAILIDVGIRTWGIPRLYAIATALALASTTDPKAEFDVFRATTGGVEPVDLRTRGGIDALVSAMEAEPHPGDSLEAFFESLQRDPNQDESHVDCVIVTHPDVMADPDFMRAISDYCHAFTYMATVDRDGSFNLAALTTGAGMKPIRQARLDLERILSPAPARRALNVPPLRKGDAELPSILFADPFPLHLPHRADPRKSTVSEKWGLISVTDDGRLLHWRDAKRGGRQLTSRLPHGWVRVVNIDDLPGTTQIVITSRSALAAHVVNANLNTGQTTIHNFELREASPLHVFAREGVVYFVYRKTIRAHNLSDGAHVASLQSHHRILWERGRFVRVAGQWCALAYDGFDQLRLEFLSVPAGTVTLFDLAGSQGYCAVLSSGRIVSVPKSWEVNFPSDRQQYTRVLGVSPDGQRIVVREGLANVERTLLLQLRPAAPLQHYKVGEDFAEALLAPTIYASTQSYAVPQVHFKGIYVDREARLSLISRKNVVFHLRLDPRDRLVLTVDHGVREMPNVRSFAPFKRDNEFRLKLQKATWADGSIAWLDRRGLLHLKSSDPAIPEMSVTLTSLLPAVWTTEGKVCGPAYFIGDEPAAPGSYFADVLRRFVGRVA